MTKNLYAVAAGGVLIGAANSALAAGHAVGVGVFWDKAPWALMLLALALLFPRRQLARAFPKRWSRSGTIRRPDSFLPPPLPQDDKTVVDSLAKLRDRCR